LQNLILKLSLLDLRLFEIVNTIRLYILITKIAKRISKIIAIFISTNKKNNIKNYLYIKVNIDLQY